MSEQEKQALVTSLRLLTVTPKSRRGLARKLEERGFPQTVIEGTLDHLEKQGVLNDRALGQSLLQSYLYRRPSGRKRIAFEMEKRGIKDSLIEELLEKDTPEEERARALDLARNKVAGWKKLDRTKRRKKLYDFLVRRGFDFNLSREVAEEVEREGISNE